MRNLLSSLLALVVAGAALTVAAPGSYAVADRDCGDFDSQRAAQIFYLKHGGPRSDSHRLDADDDGIACDTNPAPYYHRRTLPPKPVTVRSSLVLSTNRAQAIAGEPVRLTAVARPRGVRTVVFQRKVGRRWQVLDRDRTNRRGRDSLTVRAPRSATVYRAVLLKKKVGNKTFTTKTSNTRRIRVQRQVVTLDLAPARVSQQTRTWATVVVGPVRPGRAVALEVWTSHGWDEVRRGQQNRRGRTTFPVRSSDQTGRFQYRAVVLRANGAAAKASATRALRVVDTVDPAAPAELDALAGDEAATVSWFAVEDSNPVVYEVRHRINPDGAWSPITTTADTWLSLDNLQNDSTYDVQVRTVDQAGNRSPWAITQVVPEAPPAP